MLGVLLALFQLSTALEEISISSAQQSSSRDASTRAGNAIDGDISTSSYTVEHEKSWIGLQLNGPTLLTNVMMRGQAAASCVFLVNLTLEDGSTRFCEEYTRGGKSLIYNKNLRCEGGIATAVNISEKEACPQAMRMYEIKAFGPCEKGHFSAPKEIGMYTLVGHPWRNMTEVICTECAPGTFSGRKSSKQNCDVCEAGKWSVAGAEKCTPCAAGKWSNAGDSSCTECTAGTWTLLGNGIGSCESCLAGNWSAAGAASCETCAAGKWSHDGAAECTDCTGGKTSEPGSTSVSDCYYGKKLDFKRNCTAICFYFTRLRQDP